MNVANHKTSVETRESVALHSMIDYSYFSVVTCLYFSTIIYTSVCLFIP